MSDVTKRAETKDSGSLPSVFGAHPFKSIQEEMDRMFHAFSAPQLGWRKGVLPSDGAIGLRVDIAETEKEIQVTADLPGVDQDEVDVSLEDDVLHIRAEKKAEEAHEEKTWRVVERSHGVFERAIHVPKGIDAAAVQAKFEKGVLTVTLPKPPEAAKTAQRIAIKAH